MVNRQWKDSAASQPDIFRSAEADLVRQHLLHLVASHHGTKEWGSPVTPKTPEAVLLHAIDNMDAKMEIIHDVYNGPGGDDGGIFDGGRLMGGTAILPLAKSLSNGSATSADGAQG
jgi:3'-5' exoribonuclease